MSTINAILNEVKEVPSNRLEELYQFVHSLTSKTRKTKKLREKILSFGGAFSDMNKKDYSDFVAKTKKSRSELLDRKIKI